MARPARGKEVLEMAREMVARAETIEQLRQAQAVVLPLGELYAPDMVAEVAERFMSLEGMRWSLGYGEYEGDLYFSIRTSDRRANAGRLIREIIEARGGSAGGHGTMAGARLPLKAVGAAAARRLTAEVVRAFLKAFGVKGKKARRLLGAAPPRRRADGAAR